MPIAWTYRPPEVNALLLLAAARPAVEEEGARALLDASQPLVPVDTGALKESGRVEHDGAGAAVIYDATAADDYAYGIRQHEDLSLHHPNGGEAKFLEKPMHQAHGQIGGAMAVSLKKVFE